MLWSLEHLGKIFFSCGGLCKEAEKVKLNQKDYVTCERLVRWLLIPFECIKQTVALDTGMVYLSVKVDSWYVTHL